MRYKAFGDEPYGNPIDPLTKQPTKGDPITAIGIGISAFSTFQQMSASSDAADAAHQQADLQAKAEQAKSRQSEVEAQRERVKQVREGRIRAAQVVSSTGNESLGFSGTSGNVGSTSSITSQVGNNIGNINQNMGFASEISGYNIAAGQAGTRIADAQADGMMWQKIGGVGDSIFQAKGGWTTIFGGNKAKTATPSI
jgi:hypothetical protein